MMCVCILIQCTAGYSQSHITWTSLSFWQSNHLILSFIFVILCVIHNFQHTISLFDMVKASASWYFVHHKPGFHNHREMNSNGWFETPPLPLIGCRSQVPRLGGLKIYRAQRRDSVPYGHVHVSVCSWPAVVYNEDAARGTGRPPQ